VSIIVGVVVFCVTYCWWRSVLCHLLLVSSCPVSLLVGVLVLCVNYCWCGSVVCYLLLVLLFSVSLIPILQ